MRPPSTPPPITKSALAIMWRSCSMTTNGPVVDWRCSTLSEDAGVERVQAGAGLVEDDSASCWSRSSPSGELERLCLAARQRGGPRRE
jgi:hypothetical protein